jgi:hypothetical protein
MKTWLSFALLKRWKFEIVTAAQQRHAADSPHSVAFIESSLCGSPLMPGVRRFLVLAVMMDKETARRLALERIAQSWDILDVHPVILDEETIERDFGWVFFYDSSEHIETGDFGDALAGNAPIIVNKHDGSLHLTGTYQVVEEFIEAYERTGDPHA